MVRPAVSTSRRGFLLEHSHVRRRKQRPTLRVKIGENGPIRRLKQLEIVHVSESPGDFVSEKRGREHLATPEVAADAEAPLGASPVFPMGEGQDEPKLRGPEIPNAEVDRARHLSFCEWRRRGVRSRRESKLRRWRPLSSRRNGRSSQGCGRTRVALGMVKLSWKGRGARANHSWRSTWRRG